MEAGKSSGARPAKSRAMPGLPPIFGAGGFHIIDIVPQKRRRPCAARSIALVRRRRTCRTDLLQCPRIRGVHMKPFFRKITGFDPRKRERQTLALRRAIVEPMEQRVLMSVTVTGGSLDSSFATGGSLLIPTTNGATPTAAAVAVQSNGQIDLLTCAYTNPSSIQLQVTRLQSNGSVDTTFGTNGVATIPTPVESSFANLIVQPNGDLLAFCGSNTGPSYHTRRAAGFIVCRRQGLQETLSNAESSAVMPGDGKILVLAGWSVYRFNADGSTDTTT